MRPSVRYYSEREHPLAPPRDFDYVRGDDGVVYHAPRDQRMWMSVEWAAEHGIDVPDNWRELP